MATSQKKSIEIRIWSETSQLAVTGGGNSCFLGHPRQGRQPPGCARTLVMQRQLPASWQVKREKRKFANKPLTKAVKRSLPGVTVLCGQLG